MDRARSPRRPQPVRERADQATVRRTNLALVLRHLRDHGPRSRARVASETGLNKATVSSLISELVARGLVREGAVKRDGAVGRPGQIVELDGRGICGIGVELNVDYFTVLALDLSNAVRYERRVALDVPKLGPDLVMSELGSLTAEAIRAVWESGTTPAGVTLAVPGLVDVAAGALSFAPNLGWRDVRVVDALAARIGPVGFPIRVGNDANLSAIAEYALGGAAGTPDLVYLTGEVGVGGGVIVAGRLLRGAEGFSGEVGHLPLDPQGHTCGCGRRGCWETMVGLAALLRLAASPDDPVRDPSLDLERRLAVMQGRAEQGDRRTLDALQQIGVGLGLGASILVNLFNPRVIVLGGYFAILGPYLLEPLGRELRERVIARDVGGCRVELSTLGFTAAARGGAYVALEAVLNDPTVVAVGTPRVARSGWRPGLSRESV